MIQRRRFLQDTMLSFLAIPALDPVRITGLVLGSFPLEEATIDQMQQQMQRGHWSAVYLTTQYLKRIEAIDRKGPGLNAIIEVNPDALKIARGLDLERQAGRLRGPLHGIPVLIKDNIDTADRMTTTAGSLALEGHHAAHDAFIINKLREAGAVLLGKTNLSEWANFRSTRSSSGWSSRGGQTKNPYAPERSPCGSSSGSGAAVAANLCALAIGTETDGSIACPASTCGIVGIKPTVGLWSRSGIIPISATQDTAGPMARTVRDAAILLGALAAIDEQDAATLDSFGKAYVDYTAVLSADALLGRRIGVEKAFLKGHEGVTALLDEALQTMRSKGAQIVEVELKSRLQSAGDAEYTVLCYEFKDGLNRYLSGTNARIKNLAELIEFNRKNEARVMPWFKQEILETCEAKSGLDNKEYLDALAVSHAGARQAIDAVLQENNLDAIIGPANGPSWCIDLVNGDAFTGYGAYSPAAMAGYPSVTVPMGQTHGLPVGLAFTGSAFQEAKLLALAYAYEQASKKRTPPPL